MSLINQMLKDLESRRTPEQPAGTVLRGHTPRVGGRRPGILIITLILLAILLAIGLGYTLWHQQAQQSTVQIEAPAPAPRVSTAAPAQPISTPMAASPATATPAQPSTTVITPRQPELIREAKSAHASDSPRTARLTTIIPSIVEGSWQSRSFTLKGVGLGNTLNVIVSWGGKEKLLPAGSVEWLDDTTARIQLTTGNNDEFWQVALVRPDGSRSEAVEFEVIGSSLQQGPSQGNNNTAGMEKVIHPPSTMELADQLYQQGYRELQQRRNLQADELWQRALKTEPAHEKTREGLIALYLSQGRKVEATTLLTEGVARHPQNGNFAQLYARLQAEQGDTAQAIATLEQAIGRAEPQATMFALAAALYQQQRDYAKSISAYQRALQMQPQQGNWWMGVAISLEGAGKAAEAESAYEEALKRGGLSKESQGYVQQRLDALK